jgi:hypothetical protein
LAAIVILPDRTLKTAHLRPEENVGSILRLKPLLRVMGIGTGALTPLNDGRTWAKLSRLRSVTVSGRCVWSTFSTRAGLVGSVSAFPALAGPTLRIRRI